MELPKESTVQDEDPVHLKLKESVHRTVQRYIKVCPKAGEAKILAELSPTKLDVIADNIFKGIIFPDHLMEPERQGSLDQITLFCVLEAAVIHPPARDNQ
ncbi:hypothetical protein JR316_0006633 [Psilocybe cubensis]|uniref:Uncharacterized protein n=1 Tax=Psilocybe cubensis TaxID=181762 RepID=A0ACB8GWM7_PSICU|nr:hypothetical protein JR316_0006633 [Psilocybe cubensis]KAH9480036.1 hypothetical protein JR316_0006633 [Psilocybe cubensis]